MRILFLVEHGTIGTCEACLGLRGIFHACYWCDRLTSLKEKDYTENGSPKTGTRMRIRSTLEMVLLKHGHVCFYAALACHNITLSSIREIFAYKYKDEDRRTTLVTFLDVTIRFCHRVRRGQVVPIYFGERARILARSRPSTTYTMTLQMYCL